MLILASANGTMRPWKNAYSIIGRSTRHLLCSRVGELWHGPKSGPIATGRIGLTSHMTPAAP
jgi:hypothetical protein